MDIGVDWEHRVGPSASDQSGRFRLLAHNVTFAECLATCEAAQTGCSAVEYVLKHVSAPSPFGAAEYPACPTAHKAAKRSCFAISMDAWHTPCTQPLTETVVSLKLQRPRQPAEAKNVLLAIFDDLRVVDRLHYVTQYTPHMNAFRASATTFLSAHAQTALCAPSRASFLSGRRPDLTRVHWTDRHLRQWNGAKDWLTLPQHFLRHGYHVVGAGKLFHKMSDPTSLDPQSWSEPECVVNYPYFGQGTCPEKPDVLLRVFNTTHGCPVERQRHPAYTFTDEQVLRKALALLRKVAPDARSRRRPFWIGVGFFKPHKPHVFPAELLKRFANLETQLPANLYPPAGMASMANIPELCAASVKEEALHGMHRCAHENIRMYHISASFTDSLLGELLGELEAQHLSASTLVVVMGDHGFALGEHGSWAKWTNWEVATRTPFAIRAPWLPASAGKRVSTPIELVDLFPTVADLAGVPLPARAAGSAVSEGYGALGGRSLSGLLRLAVNSSEGAAFSQIARCWPAGGAHNSTVFREMGQCDGVPSAGYAFMGYSMRVATARFTEWVPTRWDAALARHMPQWSETVASELYDHSSADDLEELWSERTENANLVQARPAEAAMLRHRLRAHFDATLTMAAAH